MRWLTPGAVEDSSSMWEDSMAAEGWGLYSEALMAEPQPGAPNGFYTPEERLYQLQGKLYRDLRVRIDTGIHTGRMSLRRCGRRCFRRSSTSCRARAATRSALKNEAKRASCETAERAIFRYSKWPTQAITYRLGKDEIYALREEAAKRLGDQFSTEAVPPAVHAAGNDSERYFRDELIAQPTK